ncbi:MAG: hypothetical protein WCW13_02240 [archaeon]|jgi:hypothetical protein
MKYFGVLREKIAANLKGPFPRMFRRTNASIVDAALKSALINRKKLASLRGETARNYVNVRVGALEALKKEFNTTSFGIRIDEELAFWRTQQKALGKK